MIAEPIDGLDIKSARIVAQFDALVERMSKRHTAPAHTLLNAEARRAAEVFAVTGSTPDALAMVNEKPWEAYLSRVWISTAPIAGAMIADQIAAAAKAAAPAIPFLTETIEWLRTFGGVSVAGITNTSREEIGDQIRIGYGKGENLDQIAARIVRHRRSISPERAQTIARTEVHSAANFGSLTAAIKSTAPLNKVWVARSGARPTHSAAGGQKKRLEDPFTVGGHAMKHPGDSSLGAPAGEIVHCRCTMVYDVALPPAVEPARPQVAA